MKTVYTTLYFDLDNTLFDFTASEHNAIIELLKLHNLSSKQEIVELYSKINQSYWERFERGEIKKEEIFVGRFNTLLETIGCNGNAEKMADDYMGLLACGHDLINGAEEILKYLKSFEYKIYITTNGVAKTQYKRISDSGLGDYFDNVFVSENVGHQKPEKEYFDYVLNNTSEKDRNKIIIIGDSQSSDILGGINAEIDTCWFNPKHIDGKYPSKYIISSLSDLKEIL